MKCLYCGHPLNAEDDYCSNCNAITQKKFFEEHPIMLRLHESINKFLESHKTDIYFPLIFPSKNIRNIEECPDLQSIYRLSTFGQEMFFLESDIEHIENNIKDEHQKYEKVNNDEKRNTSILKLSLLEKQINAKRNKLCKLKERLANIMDDYK